MGVKVQRRGDLWYVSVNHKGKRTARSCGTGKVGKKAAEQAAVLIAGRLAAGDSSILEERSEPEAVPTFKALAEKWPTWYVGLYGDRRFNTMRNHAAAINAFLPTFGSWPVTRVTRKAIQDFIIANRGRLADSTLRVYTVALKAVLDYAVEMGHVAANPMRGGAPLWKPTKADSKPDPFNHDELNAIIEAAEALSPAFGLMVRVWAQSGPRSGEIRGLRRRDLDVANGAVRIERTLTHGRTGDPKTNGSRRTASIVFPTAENVQHWHPTPASRSVLDRLMKVVPLDPDAPLFPSLKEPRRPLHEYELEDLWDRVIAAAKVRRRTPETLRHSFVSTLLSRGAPPLLVANQTGHSASVMFRYYAAFIAQPSATPAQPQPQPVSGVVPASPRGDGPKLASGGASRNFSL